MTQPTKTVASPDPLATEIAGSPSTGPIDPALALPAAWPVGALLGSIRVTRLIAVGGMGEVYEGFDESLRRRVALKALRRDRFSPDSRARLLREARLLSQLSDPRICAVHGWLEDPAGDFLVLELIEGETLEGAFSKGLTRGKALRLATDLAEVLAATHRKGIIHRDLKPSNLMCTSADQLKVLDFGISSVGFSADDDSAPLDLGSDDELRTQVGRLIGTFAYMSPEQARGEKLTPASDMFAFGLVLEELLTGRRPHGGISDPLAIITRLQREDRPQVIGLPASLATLINRLTAREPEIRPRALDVVERLQFIADGARRRLRRLSLAGLAAVALAAGVWHTRQLTIERNLARAAEHKAETARREAEEVVEFLQQIFADSGPLRATGRPITAADLLARGSERLAAAELADQPAVRARLMATIGAISTQVARFDEAERLLTESLALRERVFGLKSEEAAESLLRLGDLRLEQGRLPEAIGLLERSVAITRKIGGRELARRLQHLAIAVSYLADSERAEGLFLEALRLQEAQTEKKPQVLRDLLVNIGNFERRRTRYLEALRFYDRAAALDPVVNVGPHARGQFSYNRGITLAQLGRFAEAETSYLEARTAWAATYGAEHSEVVKVDFALATIDRKEKRWEAAETRYLNALAVFRKIHGPHSVNVGFALNNLANLYLESERPAKALPLYEEAGNIFARALKPDHPYVAMTLSNRGRTLAKLGRARDAVALLEEALKIDRAADATGPDVGWDLIHLAHALWPIDREAARTRRREALEILNKKLSPEHPDLVGLRAELPELYGP